MSFKLIPPPGLDVDVTKGEQAAEAVFAARGTAPEIAKFGYEVAYRYQMKRRHDPPTEEELTQANIFSLAWASGVEACTGSQKSEGWQCDVIVPDGVFVRVPGASVEAIRRGMEAAREVFRREGVTPQEGAMGQHEQLVFDVHGFQGPEPSAESARAAGVHWDAEQAALTAVGPRVPDSGLSIEGFDTPYWQERFKTSEVLNWKGEEADPIAA